TIGSTPLVAYQRSPSLPDPRFVPLRKVSVSYGCNMFDVKVSRIEYASPAAVDSAYSSISVTCVSLSTDALSYRVAPGSTSSAPRQMKSPALTPAVTQAVPEPVTVFEPFVTLIVPVP